MIFLLLRWASVYLLERWHPRVFLFPELCVQGFTFQLLFALLRFMERTNVIDQNLLE